ncbi:SfiI-subtelomeric fragment related protein family member, putative [Theileria annulata]|uniref:SfiI-subtelomeric related protein family member, putative n=1 Tax=Theileria annulata TaxID=5874 RepID=Q4UFT9_THEAN|nr:SfiI-subtelomeric fragment related protein family member, putative [Theileria annulata]CAI74027.1 SfiI-subtelomeric fragment related protein family member, putative [Theileria annulata]
MKRWIITLNLLFYITILNQWNGAESHPTYSSTGSPTSGTAAVDSGSTESTPAATTLTHNGTESISTTPDATQSSDTATTVATPIALDLNTSKSTNEFDYTDQNGVVTFKPNSGYVFSKVSQGTKMVWESTNNVHVTLVRTKSEDNKKYLIVLLTNDMFKVYQLEGNEWNDITSMRRDISKLKFLGDTDTPIKSTDYTVSINYFSYEFIFNDGVKCKMIKYGDHEVWKHSDDTKFKMIKKFRLGLVTNSFFVLNESDSKQVAIKVSLNLNISESTDHHNYTDHNGVVTYTTKDGYVFNKIVDGTTGIWESKDDVFSSLVMSKTIDDGKYLSMLLQDNSFKVFHLDVGEWKDLTSKRHDITKLKFLREGDTEITKNDFTVSIADYSYRFTFNSGVKCKKINFGNAEVWKHSDDSKFAEIISFSLGLASNKLYVTNLNDQSKQVGIKVTLDISKTTSTDEFEYKDENEVVTYTPKPGNLFEKIVKKGLVTSSVDVWESKDNVYGTLVRIKVTKGVKYLAIFLDNNMFILFHEEAGTWLDITNTRPDVTKLKFLGDTDVELTSSNYTVTINYFSYEYTFNDGINCVKITYNNIPVWKPTDDSKFAEIKSFRLGFASNNFFVTNSSDQTKHVGVKVDLDISKTQTTSEFDYTDENEVVTYTVKTGYVFNKVSQGTTVVWVSKDNVFGTLVMSKSVDSVKYLAVLMTNSMFKLFNHYYYEWTEITSTKYDLTKLKFFGNNDTELKSSNLEVSLVDLSYTYQFNDGVNCKKIMLAHDDLWKHSDDPKFSSLKSLSLDLSTNKFYVKNQSDQIKEVAIKISLDIFKTESTDEYEYIKDLDFRTYTPKPGHLFKKISHSTIDIWQSKNNLYATLICIKPEGDLKYLAMLFQDNMFKLFHEQEDKPWDNITSKRHDVTKLRFLRDNDTEITSSDYKVNIVDLSYTYIFNSGVTCKKITYNNTPLWSHTDDSNFASIKSLSLDLAKDKFIITNQSDQLKELDFKTTPETQTTPITLDIEKTETTDEYSYSDQNGLVTFNPKDNYVFNKITQGTKDIWDSGDDVYSTLVMTKDDENQKYLSMLLNNNTFKLFQLENNEWTNITAKRHDITRLRFLGDNDVDLMFTDYTVTLVDLSYTFVFKSGVNCKKIKLGDDEVWSHSDDTNYAEIKSFSLGLPTNKFFVKNSSDQSKELNAVTEIPDEDDDADDQDDDGTIEEDDDDKSDTTSICSDFTESTSADTTPTSAVNKVSLDINKTESTNEFDYTDQTELITYTPKDNHVFTKVSQGTKEIWKSKNNVHVTLVMIKSDDNKKFLAILLTNNTFKLFNYDNDKWNEITKDRHDVKKLKFFGDNDAEITTSDHKVTIIDLSFTYIFNSGVKYRKIKFGDVPIWTHTEDPEYADIKSLQLDLPTNKFFVTNTSDQSRQVSKPIITKVTLDIEKTESTDQFDYTDRIDLITYKSKDNNLFNKITQGTDVVWKSKSNVHGTLVKIKTQEDGKYLVILLQNNSFVLLKLSDIPWKDVTSDKHDVTRLKLFGDNDTELSKTDYKVTINYLSYKFTFKPGVKCRKITYNDNPLWTHTDDKDFESLMSFHQDLLTNKLYVMNSSYQTKEVGIKITLNIDKSKDTDQFNYLKNGNFRTYTPKPGYLFTKIMKKGLVTSGVDIWESKEDDQALKAVLIGSKKNSKYLSILIQSGTFVLLFKSGKNKSWVNVTSERPDVTKLKFLFENDIELYSSDYDRILFEPTYGYKFNDGVNCKYITYSDEFVWKHTDDTKFKSITIFYLDLISNKLFVKNSSNHKMQVGIKVALDIDKTESTEKYYFNDQNGVITFKPKPGFLFNNVTHGTTDIWESKPGLYGSLVMTKTEDGARYIAILMTNNEFVLLKLSGKDLKDITSERPDLKKLKFLGDNDTEITESDYDVTLENDSYTITFDEDVKCKKIKYVDDDLWTHTDDTNFSDIKSFQLDIFMNRFYVTNSSDKTKQVDIKVTLDLEKTETTDKFEYIKDGDCEKYSPKPGYVFNKISEGTTGIWESKDNVYATLVRTKSKNGVKYLALLMTDDMFTVFQEEAGEWHDITSDRHDLSKLTFFGENDTEITKSQYTVTLQDLSYTYKFNDGVTCRKITYNNTPLWTHSDDTDFSDIKSLSLDLPKNKFSVTNKSDEKKEVDVKVSLDIQRTQSTNQFDYTDDNGVVSFTPKSSHVFNKVSEGNTVIWESRDDVYCTLVRTKSVDGVRFLALLLENSLFKLFHLDGNNWKDLTSDRPDITNLKFLDDNNLELKSSDYQVKLVGLSYTIKFNTDVNCKKITYNDMPVWTHTDHANFSEIKSLSLDLPKNKFIIKNSSDQTMQVGVKVSLDIQKTQSTDQFEYFKDDDCHTFTPKSGYIFNKVSHVTDPVWESSDCVFGTLVRTKVSKDVKYLAMLLTNDMFKVFHEESGQWKDITSMRRDVTRLKFIDDNDVEISSSDYTVSIVDLLYNFTFDDGVKCKMITYCDDEVWKHSDDPKFSEITKFRLGLVSNNFFVLNASEFKKVGIKICLDIDKTESTEKYYFNDQNGLLTFTPNSGYVFNKVTEGTKEIWESKDNVYASMTMSMTLDNKKFLAILLTNNMFKLFNLYDGKWKDITPDKYDVTKLKFYGENDAELKASDYNVSLENDSFSYIFNDGVSCKNITYSDLDVWTHTDDKDYSEIKSFSLGLSSNKFSVTNSSDHSKQVDVKVTLNIEKTQSTDHFDHSKDDKFHTFTPKSDYVFNKIIKKGLVTSAVDIWESGDDLCGTLVVTKDESGLLSKNIHLAILLKDNTFVLLHSSDKGKNWKDITSQRYDIKKLKFFDEKDNELSQSDYEVTLVNLSYQHKFNDSVNCKNITYNDITIWKHPDDSKFQSIKSLHLDLLSNKFSVINSSDQTKELKDITMVSLDIDKTQSTSEFHFTDKNGVITYSPKSSHVFNKVSQGTTVIWESSNDIQCTLATITSKDNIKYLSLLLKDNMFKLFKLDGNEWNDLTSQRHDPTKLKFLGEGETELTPSDFKVTLAGDSYEYKFKDSVKCMNIMYDNMPVWSHIDDQDFSEIRSFSLDLPNNKLYVTNTSDQKKEVDIKLSLDIENTQSTTEFEYTDEDGLVTFTPKDSYVFYKVSHGTVAVWESKGDVYGTMVMTKTLDDQKYLAILLSDNMFTLFNEDDNEWKDLTKDRLDITNLKFLGDNDTPLKPSDLEVTLQDLSYEYKFNEDAKCRKIKYDDLDVWTHSDDTKFAEIKSLQLDLPTNKFFVKNSSDETKQVDIKVTLDIEKTESTSEFDFSDDNGLFTYKPKDNRVFNKLVEGTKDIWQSKSNVHATLVMSKTLDDVKYLAMLLSDNMFTLFDLESDGTWHDITSQRLDISKLKFLGEGDTELTKSHYSVNLSNFSYTYKFNTGVVCKNITYGDSDVWNHNDDTKFSEIKSFALDLPTNKFFVTNLDDQTKDVDIKVLLNLDTSHSTAQFDFADKNSVITYSPKSSHVFSKLVDGATDIWESKTGLYGSLVMSKTVDDGIYVSLLLTDNTFKLFKLSGGSWADLTSEKYDVTNLKFLNENDTEIKSSDLEVSLVDFSICYSLDNDFMCRKIMYGDDELWTHTDDAEFADIKSLSLDLPNNKFNVTNTSNNKKELDIKVTLDIANTHSTDDFDFTEHNGVTTFTPKSDHVFTKVTQSDNLIWESTNNVHATLVMNKSEDNKRFLVILLDNNMFKLFHLENNEWTDITIQKHNINKLKFFGENDTELSKSDFEVTLQDLSYEFMFKAGVKCKKITYNDNLLWTHTDDSNYSEIKSLQLDLPKNKFSVMNSNDETKEVDIKVTLDLEKTEPTNEFEYTDHNDVVTYKPKDNHVFNKVSQGTTSIWQSSDGVFGTLVMSKTSKDVKYLAMLMNDNMFKLFKEEDNKWNDITSQRSDLMKLKFLGNNDTPLIFSDFTLTLHDLSYTYTFNTGVNCRKIMYGNNDVWTHIDDPKFASLKSLSLDLPSNKLYVTNTSDQKKEVDIKVSLDINVTQSTDEFDFADQFGLITFTPKDNHVFSKVSQGSTGIWESKDSVFGILVMSKTLDDKKYLAILLTNHSFKLFNEESGKFNDITPDRYDITKLKFLGENDAEITKSDYKVDLVDLSYEYNFNEDTKCKKITYNNSEVWNHTYDKDFSELKSIALDLPTNKFSVTNTSDQSLPVDIKVTLNIQRTESTDEYDFNDQSGLFTYKPKDNYVFNKVTQGSTDIWQSKNNLYGTLVMSKTVDNDKYLALLLTNNMFLLFHQDQDGNWANITAMRHDIKKLKFLGDGDNPLSNSDYTVTIVDLSYQYKFKDGVKCHTVKLGEGDLWKHSDDSDFSEIKSFQLDLPTNKFSVTNLKDESIQLSKARVPLDIQNTHSTNECHYSYDHDIHTFTPKPNYVFTKVTQGTTGICESKTDFYGTLAKFKSLDEGNKKYLLVLQDNNTFKLFHEVSGQWHDITSKRHDLTKLKFLRDGNTEITSSDYSVGIVDYSYEYKFNTGVRCKKIKLGEEELWKHSDDTEFQSIKSFSLDLLMNKFFIKNSTDKTKQLGITVNVDIPKLLSTPKFILVSQTPQPESAPTQTQTAPTSTTQTPSTTTQTPETPETPETKPVTTPETTEAEATPESTSETAEAPPQTSQTLQAKSTYEPVYQTLTAKSDNLFDKVSDGNTVVWESNDDVCGTMVSIKSDRKEIHLAVLLQDNDFVLVHKDNKDDTWKDVTSERADVTNLKFLDDTDTELSPSDYTVTIVDLSYEHELKPGVICKKVTHGDDEVWTHSDDTNYSEIKKLSLDLPSNKFSITNLDDQKKELSTTFTRVSVEIKKKDPNRQYDYSKSSNFHKFTPKDGNLFTKVSKGSDVVWDSKVEYVTLVNIKTEQNQKYLSMLLQNNSFVVLQKSDNTWKDITSERYDITKLKFFGDNDNPLTKNDYTTTIADCSYRFKFNDEVICKTIKYGDDDVWKHSEDTNFEEITMLDLNLTNNKFSVTNNQSNSKELDYNGSITPAETTPADTSKPKLKLPKLPGAKSQSQTSYTKPVSTPAVSTKNTLISLDINSTQSTSEFDYTDQSGVITFTPKDNHVFSKLVEGTKVVWETKPVLYGTELMYIEGVKYLVVQLQDNTFKLFVHFAGIWTDITHKRYDITKLKFLGENDLVLTSSDYKITIFRFFYTFTFDDNVKCKKIMYGEDEVWKHHDDPDYSEIKKFQIGLASNESFVFNNKFKSKKLDYKPETTKSKPKSETPDEDETTDSKAPETPPVTEPTPVTPTEDDTDTKPVTILTVDIDKTQSTDDYDYILEH